MSEVVSIKPVETIMLDFARITGLEPYSQTPKRYLWTDAFAVCNFLELFEKTKNQEFLDLALRLVDQVHHTLGRHRSDDVRTGWISGLEEAEGEKHPTVGGLRIGKRYNERKADKPADPSLEWEQDGQYFHYLTKWMHALERTGAVTQEAKYVRWAVELAKKAESRFVHDIPSLGQKRMYWKMSIDLTYPEVASMGQHDALDGFVTYSELRLASRAQLKVNLGDQISEISNICRAGDWTTNDSLGIGGLLFDALRIGQLMENGYDYGDLLERVLDSSSESLRYFDSNNLLRLPADYRLAFRELGLSIGLRALDRLSELIKEESSIFHGKKAIRREIEDMRKHSELANIIERYWSDPDNQRVKTWVEHREINMVMLATSLAPGEFLAI